MSRNRDHGRALDLESSLCLSTARACVASLVAPAAGGAAPFRNRRAWLGIVNRAGFLPIDGPAAAGQRAQSPSRRPSPDPRPHPYPRHDQAGPVARNSSLWPVLPMGRRYRPPAVACAASRLRATADGAALAEQTIPGGLAIAGRRFRRLLAACAVSPFPQPVGGVAPLCGTDRSGPALPRWVVAFRSNGAGLRGPACTYTSRRRAGPML
jgi:hypothetical protein